VIAHRGDSAYVTENTLPAFESAFKKGAHILETDIHLTKDRKVAIWHDNSFSGFPGGSAEPFAARDYRDIAEEGRTLLGHKVPLLSDLLEELPDACINIDLKDRIPELADLYAEVLHRHQAVNRCITGSFHHAMISRYRALLPNALTSASPREVKSFLAAYLSGFLRLVPSLHTTILQVPETQGIIRVVSQGFARLVKRKGGKVHVWTVNDLRDMERLYSWGVQGIVTDNPGLALSIL
ncbi:MAG: hypothetical protein JXB03_11285, partial [Spirochaetales bacterium]|nr:hypothetical protein [Spirochaetales bacterium]